jgi:hypothetical protein
MRVRDDKVLFYGLWLTLSYVVTCYLFFGVLAVGAPTPHPGTGVLVFGWLLSPSFPFYAVSSYFEKGLPGDQLVPVLIFGAGFLVSVFVVGWLMHIPVVVRLLRGLVRDRVA